MDFNRKAKPEIGWLQSLPSGELDAARAAVTRHAVVTQFDNVEAVAATLADRPLRMVALTQPRRGVWTEADCDRLAGVSPLTQLIGVHGSWCEGWQRTGHPWPGVEHYYWHQLPGCIGALLATPALPRVAESTERLQYQPFLEWLRASCEQRSMPIVVAVSADAATRSALSDAVNTGGLAAIQLVSEPDLRDAAESRSSETTAGRPTEPNSDTIAEPKQLGIWDGDIRSQRDAQRLSALCRHCDHVLAITLAPRLEDWRQLSQHTLDILTKPFDVLGLYEWLWRHVGEPVSAADVSRSRGSRPPQFDVS